MSRGLWIALCLSTCIAIILSVLPQEALVRESGTLPAFFDREQQVRSVSGLVDQLDGLDLQNRLVNVRWSKGKIVVQLAVNSGSKLSESEWRDVYRIAHRFLVGVSNVEQAEIQVVSKQIPNEVLATISADRDMLRGAPEPDSSAAPVFAEHNLKMQRPSFLWGS